MERDNLTERESLDLITEMISKAKSSFQDDGTYPILWGAVISICGLVSFAQMNWNYPLPFDIWLLALIAVIPQVILTIREKKQRKVQSHSTLALNAVWIAYVVSIFGLVFYFNVIPHQTDRLLLEEGSTLSITTNGVTKSLHAFVPSLGSLLLILYAIPTLATGMIKKFRPMIYGAILCYIFFIISCFVITKYDMFLTGLAGIFNWLVPGLILRARFLKTKRVENV